MTVCKTATGKSYPCDFMGVASDFGALYFKLQIDLFEVLNVFQDPEETSVLQWIDEDAAADADPVIRTETGFTTFGGFVITSGDCPVRVRMLKGGVS